MIKNITQIGYNLTLKCRFEILIEMILASVILLVNLICDILQFHSRTVFKNRKSTCSLLKLEIVKKKHNIVRQDPP